MLFSPKSKYVIRHIDWTQEDEQLMHELSEMKYMQVFIKLLEKRLQDRMEDLVNGQDNRQKIEELKDTILQLKNYADSN